MDSPVSQVMASLPGRLRADRAAGWAATYHLRLGGEGGGDWTVRLADGRCAVSDGAPQSADCTVEMKTGTFLAIVAGSASPQVAYMMGKIRVSNMAAMLRFLRAFRRTPELAGAVRERPAPEPGGERQDRARSGHDAAADPLAGTVVVDLSRMLPGAVMARSLLDLGARVIKVEDPDGGDPLRGTLPLVDGVGLGFHAFLHGCQSVALDLSDEDGANALRLLVRHADVLVESFAAGTLARWGIALEQLLAINPTLVTCSLSSFARASSRAGRPGHDLNFVALAGILAGFEGDRPPPFQLADVSAGLLGTSAVLAGLLQRARRGLGCHVEQPLATATLPLVAWAWAEAAAGGGSAGALLSGRCPAYRTYRCGDGKAIAVGALEPKFWERLVAALGMPHLAGVGLDLEEEGRAAATEVAGVLSERSSREWVAILEAAGVPVSPVHHPAEAVAEEYFTEVGAVREVRDGDGKPHHLAGSFFPSFRTAPPRLAPRLGAHTREVLDEFRRY